MQSLFSLTYNKGSRQVYFGFITFVETRLSCGSIEVLQYLHVDGYSTHLFSFILCIWSIRNPQYNGSFTLSFELIDKHKSENKDDLGLIKVLVMRNDHRTIYWMFRVIFTDKFERFLLYYSMNLIISSCPCVELNPTE